MTSDKAALKEAAAPQGRIFSEFFSILTKKHILGGPINRNKTLSQA